MKAADFMRVGETRRLTPAEAAMAEDLFGAGADWARVQIVQAPRAGFAAMVPFGGQVVFGRWRARRDFSEAPLQEQGWFVHELAHVLQARRGIVLALAKLNAIGLRAYRLPADLGARLNIEQQAEIARALFLARRGEKTTHSEKALERALSKFLLRRKA